tara:strand:- start:809 stop:1975 length:1167 start_codon:yes stop_codon:yes gene_type:complete
MDRRPDLKIKIIDSSDFLNKLIEKTSIKSNINYSGHKDRNSLNSDLYKKWGGALMSWPELQIQNLKNNSFDIKNDKLNLLQKDVLDILCVNKNSFSEKIADENDLFINNAYVTDNINFDNFINEDILHNIVAYKILPHKDKLVIKGKNFTDGSDVEFETKKVILSTGAIENTRILLNSPKLHSPSLGKNLGDHVNIKVANLKVNENFSIFLNKENNKIWPRLQSYENLKYSKNTYFCHFLTNLNKKSSEFSLCYEKNKTDYNFIEHSFEVDDILPIQINFMLDDQDLENINNYKNSAISFLKKNNFIRSHKNKKISFNKIEDSLHPSGTSVFGPSQENSVTNSKGNLIVNQNIIVLGTGNFQRPYCFHPTLASLALTKHYINKNFIRT